ncbi:hypothetical protein [Nocardia sp. alder85J]|uniref:hypothetical protein n=1 Tax=Nocardia sp. alder85J TaxID=2862949 RepID=UPI001CD5FA54|nr:hypothetical protein [Nocardia sp. alder85J]MCX4094332.1 hypothetical protein [Nocardia sp. alder85J]
MTTPHHPIRTVTSMDPTGVLVAAGICAAVLSGLLLLGSDLATAVPATFAVAGGIVLSLQLMGMSDPER